MKESKSKYRFFADSGNIFEDYIYLLQEEARHAFFVLRFKEKDPICVFDGKGGVFSGIVEFISKDKVKIKVIKKEQVAENRLKITLAAAIPKNYKFEDIIDKATQLGVYSVIPLLTHNTVVKINPEKFEIKIKKWRKASIVAAKQCGIAYVPLIEPITLIKALEAQLAGYDLALVAALQDNTSGLKKIVKRNCPSKVIVMIGPEGDFSKEEVMAIVKKGAIAVSLGQNVLRCDTAVSSILSILQYEWGQ
ncbi:MAG: 16S rRNA (uracil(1498)-N(3))-methyltransferase [Candidatus Omnitrophica bacterium]|nr:16S rRNA (uracil(1498)-N(3))-methyltransferase [Candidatus Omnitrophota bacterium]